MGLVCLTVSNIETAKKFFEGKLGLQLTMENVAFNWLEFAVKDGIACVGVGQASVHNPSMKPGMNAVVTFNVDNIEQAKKELEEKKVVFLSGIMDVPSEVKLALFTDEDGNHFFLAQKSASYLLS